MSNKKERPRKSNRELKPRQIYTLHPKPVEVSHFELRNGSLVPIRDKKKLEQLSKLK